MTHGGKKMPDMLVKLYDLPDPRPFLTDLRQGKITIRRSIVPEKHVVQAWVLKEFGSAWASECEISYTRQPVTCYIATVGADLVGFSCYNTTYKDFFGPLGVKRSFRQQGIGQALLLVALQAMAEQGYAYAIIGGVGPCEFYRRTVGAVDIEGSVPGIYRGLLR